MELGASVVARNAEEEFRSPRYSMRAYADALILQRFGEFVVAEFGPIVAVDRAPSSCPVPLATDGEPDEHQSVRVEAEPVNDNGTLFGIN